MLLQGHRVEIIQARLRTLRVGWAAFIWRGRCACHLAHSRALWPWYGTIVLDARKLWSGCQSAKRSSSKLGPALTVRVESFPKYLSRLIVQLSWRLPARVCKLVLRAQDLKETMKKLLLAFYRANRHYKPERLLFYRDGVSEGQARNTRIVRSNTIVTTSNNTENVP